jgi:hypothetical protein
MFGLYLIPVYSRYGLDRFPCALCRENHIHCITIVSCSFAWYLICINWRPVYYEQTSWPQGGSNWHSICRPVCIVLYREVWFVFQFCIVYRNFCYHQWKQLYDHIFSLRGAVCAHKARLTLPLFIEVPVPSQKSERLLLSIFHLFLRFFDYI